MWTTDTTVSKIQPVFVTTDIEPEDFVSIDDYDSYTVNTLDSTPIYLFKIEFTPSFESNLFASINANTRIVSITSDTDTYEDATLETLNTERQYISPISFYQKNTLDAIYIFSPINEDIYLEVEYEISNMSTLKDIYPFIGNNDIVTQLQFKSAFENDYQVVTKEFLLAATITPSTSVKVHLRYKLIDSTDAITYVFNNHLSVSRKTVNTYTHTISNWSDIDMLITERGQEYYRNDFFTAIDKTGFIINSSYIYQVL
jgi:hypothetical protein